MLLENQVALAGVDAPVHLRGARLQRLDAEEAAVLGQPQYIDHGVPQPQLRDEETDIADAAETVSASMRGDPRVSQAWDDSVAARPAAFGRYSTHRAENARSRADFRRHSFRHLCRTCAKTDEQRRRLKAKFLRWTSSCPA